MRQFTGVTRRFSKKLCAWKRKAIELRPSQRFTMCWRMRPAQIGGARSFGITKPDLTLRGYWRTIQNGNLLLLSTRNWWQPGGAGAKKQKRVSTICVWNIFFGRTDSTWLKGSNLCPGADSNKLAKIRAGRTIKAGKQEACSVA